MDAQVEEAAMAMTMEGGGPVQSLKEIKKSRRTVMLGSALALPSHGEGSVLSIPLTPPLSDRASGEVDGELYSPQGEEHYENVDLSSDEEGEGDGEWDHSDNATAMDDTDDDVTELVEHVGKVSVGGQAEKPRLTSLRKILEQTPERPLPRQSSLPSPPPMTIHDFWANVVRNYKLVHRTMPGFLFHKIRDGGVPSVLRRVVWTAMAGITPEYASEMANIYSRLEVGGIGGWEKDIGRDLHRTWPDVEMFKEQNGEGQRGLRGVLGGYSVWDNHVGYCQGLGFLAGPLLMNTSSAAEAFTLLTVLMAQPSTSTSHNSSTGYSLRTLYTPNFPGLLSLIHAFNSVLTTQFPTLSTHLTSMGLTTEMYAPQWFLSMFAVTAAPIDTILLRLWDLLMMEGSHGGHTMIRIGLSLMKLNQDTLLELTEMEDCLKLLLSKSLWHNIDPDILIGIAGGEMKTLVPSEKLSELVKEYEAMTSKVTEKKVGGELQAVATRFLGRLKWTASHLTVDTTNIAPPMLRTISKGSFTASPQEMEATSLSLRAPSESIGMSRSTSATSFRGTSDSERALHAQIEDLVKVLGDVQRKVGESEVEKDSLKSENTKLREMLARVASAMGESTTIEDLNIAERPSPLSSLSDEISEILSSPSSSASSVTTYADSPMEEELRTQLTETQHTLNQERQANLLLQQQLSTTETELSRTRTALLELRTKYTDETRNRQRTRSNTPSERSPSTSSSNSSLRELKLVVRTKSETLVPPATPTPSASSSTWGSWFGRRES